ncbi:hypothetical protein ACD661_16650 [Legionella lytica]|uniref:Uncharacterized protein n=1 Tax=Legionella lytica TaxID=96232 RepID=A0ABW8DBT5_9GAMM
MGNLCSIFHSKYKNLIKVIPCARKAHLMDYILFGWQSSTYKLKNSNKKWFMKSQSEIVEDTGIALSTLQSYLKQFESEGLIERRQALYSRTTENNVFEVKKGAYISITEKLLTLLTGNHNHQDSNTSHHQHKVCTDSKNNPLSEVSSNDKIKASCANTNNIKGIENFDLRGLYIRDLYTSHKNNIRFKKRIPFVDKPILSRLINQHDIIQKYVETQIKEEIPVEIKNLILGTFFNLTFEHKKQFSSPEQVVAEYLFSLINTDFCLPAVQDFKHRNDILSKLIRNNNWRTPKGFYKHFYLGSNFKDKKDVREKQWLEIKEREMKQQPNELVLSQHDAALDRVETQIMEKGSLIEELTQSIYQQKTKEQISIIRAQIHKIRVELNVLYDEQRTIEQAIEKEEGDAIKLCA